MQNIQIIPAILPKNSEELKKKLNLLKEVYFLLELEKDDKLMVQVDVCSNELLENFNFSLIKNYIDIFNFEFDLMNININKITERLNELSRSDFNRIIFHIEDWQEKFSNLKFENFSQKIGLALTPHTSTEKIIPYLDKINFVQFMGIDEVGYQGRVLNSVVIEKIKKFREQNLEIIISVDGGVNLEKAKDLIEAGANRLVSGSAIFGGNNIAKEIADNIKKFNEIN